MRQATIIQQQFLSDGGQATIASAAGDYRFTPSPDQVVVASIKTSSFILMSSEQEDYLVADSGPMGTRDALVEFDWDNGIATSKPASRLFFLSNKNNGQWCQS